MNVYVPDYYPEFQCIAGSCRHTCCAGWEIDIDADSLKRFKTLKGSLARELTACIDMEGAPHFRLREDGRCPMLADNGLCRMILEYGQSSLCQICTDHPRFRNFWTERTEIGLGMVCEEAARIILTSSHPMKLIKLDGSVTERLPPEEEALLRFRNRLLKEVTGDGPLARFEEYLIYRHIADALYDGRLVQRMAFVKRACRHIARLWTDGRVETLCEICRRFSDEVEYDSDELEKWISGRGRKAF